LLRQRKQPREKVSASLFHEATDATHVTGYFKTQRLGTRITLL
jgi:hypothetical protein